MKREGSLVDAKAPPGWQPIETAPKDGRRIFAWCEHWSGALTVQFYGSASVGWSTSYDINLRYQPTHWMPLPPGPNEPPQWLSDPERSEVIEVLSKVLCLPAVSLSDEESLDEAREIYERLQRHRTAPLSSELASPEAWTCGPCGSVNRPGDGRCYHCRRARRRRSVETSARKADRTEVLNDLAKNKPCTLGGHIHCPCFAKGHPCCDCGATVSEEARHGNV